MVISMLNLFSKRLKELRLSKGLKQTDLAKILEMSERGYRRWELSDTEPNLDKLIFLANYFNVSTDYLLGRTNDPTFNKK